MIKEMLRVINDRMLYKSNLNALDENRLLQNDEKKIYMMSFLLCSLAAVINFVYFFLFTSTGLTEVAKRSFVLFSFGLFYYLVAVRKITGLYRIAFLTLITTAVSFYVVLEFYQLIGPAVWTFMFLIILVLTTRHNYFAILSVSCSLFALSIYINSTQMAYVKNEGYFVAQSIGFLMVIVVAMTVFKVNIRKNSYLLEQHEITKKMNNLLEQANKTMDEEINEHKSAKEQLDGSKKRYEGMIKALPDVVFTFNQEGDFLDCEIGNNRWLLLKKEEFIGKNLHDVMPMPIAEGSIDKIHLAITTSKMQIFNYELATEEGIFYYESRFNRIGENQVICILRDVTELKRRQNEIEYMSYHDYLTDMYNRRFFEIESERLDNDRNFPISIVVIDINGLKLVNDAFGHLEGDQLIKTVAYSIKEECRSDEIVARIGGDEFILLLPKTSEEDANKIMDRINTTIEEIDNKKYTISIAFGLATKDSTTQILKDMITKAEEKMYQNKIGESQLMRYNTTKVILSNLDREIISESTHRSHCIEFCKIMGKLLKYDTESIEELQAFAAVHDIGKIAVEPSILNKKETLTASDIEIIQRHSEIGYQILKATDNYASVAECVLYHHEHWNGKGYPKGLSGEEIPRFARILSVVEAYDSMVTQWPYKEAKTKEVAIKELKECAGKQFDPYLVEVFIDYILTSF
jgi:diguanylate cyclase (GGDEF)-like protein